MDAEKIIDKLNEIASPALEHYLEIATRRMLLVGWCEIIIAVVLGAVVFVLWSKALKREDKYDEIEMSPALVAALIVSIPAIVSLVMVLVEGVPRVIAPEYEAIQSLLTLVK